MTMTFTYDDYTDEDYNNGILEFMGIPLDYYDAQDPCHWYVATLFDLSDE